MSRRAVRELQDLGFGMVLVPLTRGYEALIDAADAESVGCYNWCVHIAPHTGTAYAQGKVNKKLVSLHRFLMDVKDRGQFVDHVNSDGLDNRRVNLRLTGRNGNAQNSRIYRTNTTGFKGIYHQQRCGWRAHIHHQGKLRHLGTFGSAEEAARAYDAAALRWFGEFANLNFPQ